MAGVPAGLPVLLLVAQLLALLSAARDGVHGGGWLTLSAACQ